MPKTDKELTVEECLAELREMFVGERISITERRRLLAFPDVRLGVEEERDYTIVVGKGRSAKEFSAPTLSEVMGQVRAWRKAQELKHDTPQGSRLNND